MTAPLAGVGVLVTRPAEQADSLLARLRDLGAHPLLFPTLEIQPPSQPAVLERRLADLANHDLAIFVSPTAVRRGLALISDWPPALRVAAVGQGTAAALRTEGMQNILAPDQGGDSEHLLALPELADMTGQRVLIFRGEGGRELLAKTLAVRGADVHYAECYRRGLPSADPAPLCAIWRQGGVQAVTVLSTEGLDNLFKLIGAEHAGLIRATPVFAAHPRIAMHARELGIVRAMATESAEAGLLRGLVEYFAHD